jgi:imidazoleglycerol phosphate dehydratase HisB
MVLMGNLRRSSASVPMFNATRETFQGCAFKRRITAHLDGTLTHHRVEAPVEAVEVRGADEAEVPV